MLSRMDIEDAKRANPTMDSEEPSLEKPLKERELPTEA
jgi:hypothetical protein